MQTYALKHDIHLESMVEHKIHMKTPVDEYSFGLH